MLVPAFVLREDRQCLNWVRCRTNRCLATQVCEFNDLLRGSMARQINQRSRRRCVPLNRLQLEVRRDGGC